HLESGFCALAGADVTLGPTSDGGYYLVGMKKPCPEVFQRQTYGHGTVCENTAAAAKEAGYTVLNAMPCEDVDTPEDLKTLYCRIASSNTHTARFLAELKQAGIDL
ncbi:MAG: DUF2064 domain-containing protein, partial [Clostridia bacterium]|nr:DUF2064 domain-containing protein [Clostridia bacterium]